MLNRSGRKSLLPNANERYVGETEERRRMRQVELDAISELEAKEKSEAIKKASAGSEDDSRSGGASLQMGSTEYREMLYDHQGRDEFEQAEAELERSREKKDDDYRKDDKWHGERQEALATERNRVEVFRRTGDRQRLNHRMNRRARRISYLEEMLGVASEEALETETKADDVYVRRGLPFVLDTEAYNDVEGEDDFFPGSKTLNKYL